METCGLPGPPWSGAGDTLFANRPAFGTGKNAQSYSTTSAKRDKQMKTKHTRHNKPIDESATAVEDIMEKLFRQAKAQFGNAIKSFWFYDGELCPSCLHHSIGAMKFKGQDALSINAFIYRQRGVLIGYFLCENCALHIFEEAEKKPYKQTPAHAIIEQNLTDAYHRHLASMDAWIIPMVE